MTRDEILAMEAGRELDKLVAEKVMGWTAHPIGDTGELMWLEERSGFSDPQWTGWLSDRVSGFEGFINNRLDDGRILSVNWGGDLWKPSATIATAWKVVEKMLESGWLYAGDCATIGGPGTSIPKFTVLHEWRFFKGTRLRGDCAESVPVAICRAALLAVMEVE